VTSNVATTQQLEEAAFLASYTLTEAVLDHITFEVYRWRAHNIYRHERVHEHRDIYKLVLGPIQDAHLVCHGYVAGRG